ncbi:MAG: DNA replication/repair protein RecF [Synechococcus sp. SB0662_bin_45]|uniref:DNA replication and repair protein RecF n=1 Tax=Synechococcus sp. SB0676_bin_10 TaxID=2604869 RepID=A0A6B1FCB7_9SYNE|nr:DNA replication/repair protein RecF [Cyanobacteria bacterium MAG IRC3_bin_20]MCY3653728.1 DNA replication/repair protein RecF [Cyanobacteria bacterium MAG IRC1_bin_28]MDE0647917.1 DNA replication/repair protein RecF [Cyanobacteria bacterium MAG IRC4_bin_6]MXW11887.1 DNA replication/repair protein RecF [Synechococcus sp. SB0668_bin_13]MXX08978.1 DNA replication/repair protein RecF [Synechococcus sp. SB0667_bin_8]MXY62847.1 DNA replication/repair protein RecF [Synechococcus sp. SB0665_bin_28]
MPSLSRLELQHFRSYRQASLQVEANRVIFVGANGAGKSNLLEAVELLGSLRSHRTASDGDLIQLDQTDGWIHGWIGTDGLEHIGLHLRQRGGRQGLRNQQPLSRQMDLLGAFRCVCFSSLDLALVRGEPVLRRQWLDRVVVQLEPAYGDLLSRYGRLLRQRSSLLRRHGGACPHHHLTALLDAYDQQMANLGARLHRRRQRALLRLNPLARSWQKRLSAGQEVLSLLYRPGTDLPPDPADRGNQALLAWQGALQQQLAHQRAVELRLGSCRVGPQRDEVVLQLNGQAARRYGSAGQQRCMVLALKMAEVDLVAQVSGEAPVLLLDDVLAELDPDRQLLLLEAIGQQQQCLLSTTHLNHFIGAWRRDAQCIAVRQDGEGSMLSPLSVRLIQG